MNVDAIVFESLVEQRRADKLQEAIGLYRGELLEGFQVPSPEFESWATASAPAREGIIIWLQARSNAAFTWRCGYWRRTLCKSEFIAP